MSLEALLNYFIFLYNTLISIVLTTYLVRVQFSLDIGVYIIAAKNYGLSKF